MTYFFKKVSISKIKTYRLFYFISLSLVISCGEEDLDQATKANLISESSISLENNATKVEKDWCWCTQNTRIHKSKSSGVGEEVIKCGEAGLRWLIRQQDDDGGWGKRDKDNFGKIFSGDDEHRDIVTSLALIELLRFCPFPHCKTISPDSAKNAINFLLNSPANKYAVYDKDGGLIGLKKSNSSRLHAHNLRTKALFLAYKVFKNELLIKQAVEGAKIIIDGQHSSGGWSADFSAAKDARVDLIVTGSSFETLLQLALSGRHDLYPDPACDNAVKYVKGSLTENGKFMRFPNDTKNNEVVDGYAFNILSHWRNMRSPEGKKDMENILKNLKDKSWGKDPYDFIQCNRAAFLSTLMSSKYWRTWNSKEMKLKEVTSRQRPDGSFLPNRGSIQCSELTRTCLAVGTLHSFSPPEEIKVW